jgi:pilus assembly protein CpaE
MIDETADVIVVSSNGDWLLELANRLTRVRPRTVQGVRSAFAGVRSGRPAVLVVGPTDAEELLALGHPPTAAPTSVLLVVEEVSVDILRRAMVAGIGDVIDVRHLDSLPVAVEALWERTATVAADDHPPVPRRPGKVILVTSSKAGQGATTVAANLAVTLARRGPTALLEGDPRFGDILDAFGYRQHRTELVAADLVPDHWLGRFLYRHPSGVVLVLPGPDTFASLQPDDAIAAIGVLQDPCEHIVMDVPYWELESYRLHRAADLVLIVSSDRDRDLRRVPAAVHALGLEPEQARLVVTNYVDGRTPKRTDLRRTTGLEVLGRIPETARADAALAEGRPLIAADGSALVADAFDELAGGIRASFQRA